jgi:hypothetical protein
VPLVRGTSKLKFDALHRITDPGLKVKAANFDARSGTVGLTWQKSIAWLGIFNEPGRAHLQKFFNYGIVTKIMGGV